MFSIHMHCENPAWCIEDLTVFNLIEDLVDVFSISKNQIFGLVYLVT